MTKARAAPTPGAEHAAVLDTVKARPGNVCPSLTTCVPADLDGVCASQPTRCHELGHTLDATRKTRINPGSTLQSDPGSKFQFG